MTDRDKKQASQRVSPLLEPGSREGGLLTKRRQFVKGVALGLPAILTLPRGVAADALISARCDQKIKNLQMKPADFNPGGTWLTQSITYCDYTQGIITIQAYQDIQKNYRQYPSGDLVIATNFPSGWTKGQCNTADALAYYDTLGDCKWYGPQSPNMDWIELSQSCCKSLHPTLGCNNNQC